MRTTSAYTASVVGGFRLAGNGTLVAGIVAPLSLSGSPRRATVPPREHRRSQLNHVTSVSRHQIPRWRRGLLRIGGCSTINAARLMSRCLICVSLQFADSRDRIILAPDGIYYD